MKFINFNDNTIPIGKRKQAYVKWAISKGTSSQSAKRQANEKFGFEKSPGILVIVRDYGRMNQNSFNSSEIFQECDLRKYANYQWIMYDDDNVNSIVKHYKSIGYKIANISLYA